MRAVSAPRENSVPGTLLLMVAGTMSMGMQSSLNFSRPSSSSDMHSKASNPPITKRPLILYSASLEAIRSIPSSFGVGLNRREETCEMH